MYGKYDKIFSLTNSQATQMQEFSVRVEIKTVRVEQHFSLQFVWFSFF